MKRTMMGCLLLMVSTLFSCMHRDSGRVSLMVEENKQEFRIDAQYNRQQDRKVDRYLQDHLYGAGAPSMIHTDIDADLVLNDGTRFHMKKFPGSLKIRMNKEGNSLASCQEMKVLGNGLKTVITQ